jgi:arylsulfatase A-like enzyme
MFCKIAFTEKGRESTTADDACSSGMQGQPILAAEPRGLPVQEKVLPQYLKELGYVTRAIGKWHLGFYKKEFTPTYRGFDSHLGYWGGYTSYYDHILEDMVSYHSGEITPVSHKKIVRTCRGNGGKFQRILDFGTR